MAFDWEALFEHEQIFFTLSVSLGVVSSYQLPIKIWTAFWTFFVWLSVTGCLFIARWAHRKFITIKIFGGERCYTHFDLIQSKFHLTVFCIVALAYSYYTDT